MKKAQVQMMETIAVLVVFFMLMAFGFIFYFYVSRGSSQVKLEEKYQLDAIAVAQRASFLPELQCSSENVRKEGCIDLFKLAAANKIMNKHKVYYFDIFGYATVSVDEIYPNKRKLAVLYNNPKEGFKEKLSTPLPVSIYDAALQSYAFGILTVDIYN